MSTRPVSDEERSQEVSPLKGKPASLPSTRDAQIEQLARERMPHGLSPYQQHLHAGEVNPLLFSQPTQRQLASCADKDTITSEAGLFLHHLIQSETQDPLERLYLQMHLLKPQWASQLRTSGKGGKPISYADALFFNSFGDVANIPEEDALLRFAHPDMAPEKYSDAMRQHYRGCREAMRRNMEECQLHGSKPTIIAVPQFKETSPTAPRTPPQPMVLSDKRQKELDKKAKEIHEKLDAFVADKVAVSKLQTEKERPRAQAQLQTASPMTAMNEEEEAEKPEEEIQEGSSPEQRTFHRGQAEAHKMRKEQHARMDYDTEKKKELEADRKAAFQRRDDEEKGEVRRRGSR